MFYWNIIIIIDMGKMNIILNWVTVVTPPLTLPERQEDNRFNREELEDWIKLWEELACGGVEEN